MPIDTSKTGAAIAAYRQRMNLSQQGLAGLMNVTHQAVSKWEKGLALPDTETLLALAKLFGVSMEDLLMGKLPMEKKAEEPEEAKEDDVEEPVPAEAASELPPEEAGQLDFSAVMNMMPFVSTKVADRLFRAYAEDSCPDAGKLSALAPFVSTRALNDYLLAHPLADCSPEVLCSLAPFLPAGTVDAMVQALDKPIPPHIIHMLMPFASSKVVDQMVLGKLGIPWAEDDAAAETGSESSASASQLQDKIHQKIRRKLDALDRNAIQQQINQKLDLHFSDHPLSSNAKRAAMNASPRENRESPRLRLLRKAIENGQYEMVENSFDELDDESRRMLLAELEETGGAQLLRLFCEAADELDPNAQSTLVQLLLKGKLYDELAEIIEELDEAVQHELLDRAFEINDPELLHLISEHL